MNNLGKRFMDWSKVRENQIFLAILVFAIIIRLYFFIQTKSQPIWWDESDYLAYAKNLAGLNSDWIITVQHNSLFPYVLGLLFKFGLSEVMIKFLVEIVPSALVVWLVYLVCIEMYSDKRIALISSFIMAVLWVMLFNSMRFHLAAPGLLFGLLSIYVFWKGYENKEKIFGLSSKWAIPLVAVFLALTYSIRRGYFLFGIFLFVYALSTRDWKDLLKDKFNWAGLSVFLVLFFILEKTVFSSGIGEVAGTYTHFDQPITFLPLDVFNSYFSLGGIFSNLFFYLFWIGFIVLVVNFVFHLGHVKRSEGKVKADLFALIVVVLTLFYFMFFLRVQHIFGEPRWYLPMALGMFICISRSTIWIGDYLKSYHKYLPAVFIILVVGLSGYAQVSAAGDLIEARKNGFSGIREASLFLKETSLDGEIIISQPMPQTIYYSERKVMQPEHVAGVDGSMYTLEEFLEGLGEVPEAKYLLVSFSEPGHPDWMRHEAYTQNGALVAWEIPFMDTGIDFANNRQQIVESKNFGDITFNFVDVKGDVFIYRIDRA